MRVQAFRAAPVKAALPVAVRVPAMAELPEPGAEECPVWEPVAFPAGEVESPAADLAESRAEPAAERASACLGRRRTRRLFGKTPAPYASGGPVACVGSGHGEQPPTVMA